MAKMNIPSDSGRQPTAPAGTYGAGGDAKIVGVELREVPGERNKGEYFLAINTMVQVPDLGGVFVRSSPFRNHTRLTANSGSKVFKFLAQLGIEVPEGSDMEIDDEILNELLTGVAVVVDVGFREYEYQGEKRADNWVKDISRLT